MRDQKQVDYEELSNYLQNSISDREKTMRGVRTGAGPLGIAGFFKDKYQELKGVDAEKARQARLERLSGRITEVSKKKKLSDNRGADINYPFIFTSCKRPLKLVARSQWPFLVR